MKKLTLGVVLLAALSAVTYVNMERASEREAEAFIEGHDLGVRKTELSRASLDSLQGLIDQKATELAELRQAMVDTLTGRDERFASVVDSLTQLVRAGQQEISGLEKKLAAGRETAGKASTPTKVASKPSHDAILRHYKLAVAKLPADLSAYEYRVAIDEVRSETAAKFNITVARLDEIRTANHLEY